MQREDSMPSKNNKIIHPVEIENQNRNTSTFTISLKYELSFHRVATKNTLTLIDL